MAARFYRQNIAQFSPLSFEEMAFAPSMMRKRHDELDASLSEVDTSLGQYNAMSQDQDFVQQSIDPVSKGLNSMAEQLAKQGYNSQSASEFRKLKSQKDKLWSPTGDVGIAQSRLASFQSQAKDLKEQYKNNPDIANFYINKLAQSEGLSRDSGGKVVNQGLNQIKNVRHYDAKEVNDLINSQIGNIKADTLKNLGFSNVGSISNVQDIYRQGQIDGITPEKITAALVGQMSPEVIQSARQYGEVHYGDPNAGVQQLQRQIEGAAIGGAFTKVTDSYSVITNEEKKALQESKKLSDGKQQYEFEPFTKVETPLGIDESYFSEDQVEFEQSSMAMPYTLGTRQKSIKGFKPFSTQQIPMAKEVLASMIGKDVSEIKDTDLNTPENRAKIGEYFKNNKENIRITPKVNTTGYLKEYGDDPEKANYDLNNNYISRKFIDSKSRKSYTPEEIGELLSKGHKLKTVGGYGPGAGFTKDAERNNINPRAMADPLAVNLVDEGGNIVSRMAVSRNAAYFESDDAFINTQQNLIIDDLITTPNIYRSKDYDMIVQNKNTGDKEVLPVKMQIKFNPSQGTYTVKDTGNDFNEFTISNLNQLDAAIYKNIKE